MNTVLAAIDFSPVSRLVIAKATEISRAIGGRVVLLNTVKPPAIAIDLAPVVGEVVQFTAEVERASRQHLRRIQKRLAEHGVTVETVCEQGFPVTLILAQAKEVGARYIVIGSHGHTAFYDLLVGSTAGGVLKRAPCPVVVVPAAPKNRAGRKAPKRGREPGIESVGLEKR